LELKRKLWNKDNVKNFSFNKRFTQNEIGKTSVMNQEGYRELTASFSKTARNYFKNIKNILDT